MQGMYARNSRSWVVGGICFMSFSLASPLRKGTVSPKGPASSTRRVALDSTCGLPCTTKITRFGIPGSMTARDSASWWRNLVPSLGWDNGRPEWRWCVWTVIHANIVVKVENVHHIGVTRCDIELRRNPKLPRVGCTRHGRTTRIGNARGFLKYFLLMIWGDKR